MGPDRAAAEWLLRCGAKVRFEGFERWHHDYNALPTGPLGRYKIQGIDATESCIMYRGFDHLGQCYSLDSITFSLISMNPTRTFTAFFSSIRFSITGKAHPHLSSIYLFIFYLGITFQTNLQNLIRNINCFDLCFRVYTRKT